MQNVVIVHLNAKMRCSRIISVKMNAIINHAAGITTVMLVPASQIQFISMFWEVQQIKIVL